MAEIEKSVRERQNTLLPGWECLIMKEENQKGARFEATRLFSRPRLNPTGV